MRPITILLAAAALGLTACMPVAQAPVPRLQARVVGVEPTFYPSATGLAWAYLKDNDPVNAPTYELRVEGPSVFRGRQLTAMSFVGRGSNDTYYREFGPAGVRLHARVTPEVVTVTYDPPLQEYPPQDRLVLGGAWSGRSTITVEYPDRAAETVVTEYTYRVLAEEKLDIAGTVYDTFLINLEQKLTPGEATVQSIRFTPAIGEVRTKEGLLMVGRNF